jgi:hypothetical protein
LVILMANTNLKMENIYPEDGGLNQENNLEATLQFGDFGSVIIQPVDEAELSILSLDANTGIRQSISENMSDTRQVASESSSQEIEPNDIPIYTTKELLLILQYSRSLVANRNKEVTLVPVKQEPPAPVVALLTAKMEPISLPSASQSAITVGVQSKNVSKKEGEYKSIERNQIRNSFIGQEYI